MLFKTYTLVLFIVLFLCLSPKLNSISAQTIDPAGIPITLTYPYNPEYQGSAVVGISDLLPFLIAFGAPFEPASITVNELGGVQLEILIEQLLVIIANQQAQLDQLTPLLSFISVDTVAKSVTVQGANLIVIDGSGTTNGVPNGLGNLIMGYNENEGGYTDINGGLHSTDLHTGSHNIIVGSGHTYTSTAGLILGRNNSVLAQSSNILGGEVNNATGPFSSILGGLDNLTSGEFSTIAGGHLNLASGTRSSISGGLLNLSAGIATSVLGGQYLQIFEQYETASGQYNINF